MGENGPVRFLSPEWLERMAASMPGSGPRPALSIHQRVTGGPDGDVEYTLRLGPHGVSVEPGPGEADIRVVQDYETAAAISRGEISPAAAFAVGRLKLGGRIGLLVEHQETFAGIGASLAGLPAATTF